MLGDGGAEVNAGKLKDQLVKVQLQVHLAIVLYKYAYFAVITAARYALAKKMGACV